MLPSLLALVAVSFAVSGVAAEPSTRSLLGSALVRGSGSSASAYAGGTFNLNASAATPFARRLLQQPRLQRAHAVQLHAEQVLIERRLP